jgi:hypothetical protein
VAAGVLGIVLGLFEFVLSVGIASMARAAPWLGVVSFLDLVIAGGCLTCGIILVAKHRGRKKTVPILLLVFCSLALVTLVMLIAAEGSADVLTLLISFGLAVPALILLSKALKREGTPQGFQ